MNNERSTVIYEMMEKFKEGHGRDAMRILHIHGGWLNDIKEFKDMSEEWLDFIIDCRSGKPHSHDIVIGAMANDQIYNFISDYIDGVITREQFWIMAKFKYPTHQINFCTEEALKCLKYRGYEVVK